MLLVVQLLYMTVPGRGTPVSTSTLKLSNCELLMKPARAELVAACIKAFNHAAWICVSGTSTLQDILQL
jgi:hypothetical protein